MTRKRPEDLRSHRWFGVQDLRSFGHRSRIHQTGFTTEDYAGKPVIAILNTWSDLNPCHAHFRTRAEEVKRGVWQAGGFPVELPAISLGEPYMKPSTMLYRNLLALEVEELGRSNPVDGLVLLGGCDKTVPAMLMGAASLDLPTVFLPAGAMLRGHWRGQTLGSGSDVWKYWAEKRAGTIDDQAWAEMENGIARSFGTCMTMGTASTMASIAEALGMALPGSATIPAADSAHPRMATACGRRIVEMVWEDLKPSDILTSESYDNAITVLMALSGSTNAIIHLVAMAGRSGIKIDLDRFDQISRRTPLLCNLRPSGSYLMEDFFYAGGLPALMAEIKDLLHLEARTITGQSLGQTLEGAGIWNDDVIRRRTNALKPDGGLTILRGNLAPNGAVIKHAAAEPRLHTHTGPAIAFEDYNDMAARIDDPALPVTADSVLVLKRGGPIGGPGMPEWGMLPIPKKLLAQGVRDMVRISDARMSGTSYGACILHVAPEAAVGGPIGLVQDGDLITLDVKNRTLTLEVPDADLAKRRAAFVPRAPHYERGWGKLHLDQVTQADQGCDWTDLHGGPVTKEPEIH